MKPRAMIAIEGEAPVEAQHPELHHYTNWGGLSGIWTSGVLYATRYDRLNDRTEVEHLRQFFKNSLRDRFRPLFVAQKKTGGLKISAEMRRQGGVIQWSKTVADAFVDGLYKTTFDLSTPNGAFAIPFVTSFCTHEGDASYEKKNGLLSQWRGYGKDERYAIVFETNKLVEMLKNTEAHLFTSFMDVIYNDETFDFDKRHNELLDSAIKYYQHRDEVPQEISEKLFYSFAIAAARFKHRGFREEREVRIVAFVQTRKYIDLLYKKYGHHPPQSNVYKKIYNIGGIERILLFETNDVKHLPIKRIIVGPHKHQKNLLAKVKDLTGGGTLVTQSETPFIG